MQIISEYIAPWAIAKEPFPLHLIWESNDSFNLIELQIPPDFEVKELLNVSKYDTQNGKITFKSENLLSSNYFGLVTISKTTYDEIVRRFPITVRFLKNDNEIFSRDFIAQIVRPRINFQDSPTEITITDQFDPKKLLKFNILHTGLGKVKVDFNATAKGNIISQSDSLYFQVLEEIANEISNNTLELNDDKSEEMTDDVNINFDTVSLHEHAMNVIKRIEDGNTPLGIKKELFEKLSEDLKDVNYKEKLLKSIYSKIQRIFLSYMLYYFERNPHEDIELPVGKIKVNMNYQVDSINLKISYTDSLGNSYEQIERTVAIHDLRTKKEKFQMPINIEWKSEPFKLER